jgi:hypothetical protein
MGRAGLGWLVILLAFVILGGIILWIERRK